MYRQGLGDCFLITLPRKTGGSYYIMIDCGVILGTPDAAFKMRAVVSDVIATTRGHLDLLIITHEHWDHLSGFVQARDLFQSDKLKVDKVWLAWTEDPEDDLAKHLRTERQALRLALASASARMRLAGNPDPMIDGVMEFFGAAGQGTTGDALKIVKGFTPTPRYCRPGDAPVDLEGVDARLYVLGPPHDEKMIKRFNPSKSHPETYGMAAVENLNGLVSPSAETDSAAPFDPIVQIPLPAAEQVPFFQAHYWGPDSDARNGEPGELGNTNSGVETAAPADQSWRRIDTDWLAASSDLALQLDSATNNTSLALAIELGDGRVLLFAADAQVGNWLSWEDLSWTVKGQPVTGPDLLKRTYFYKTGHHGSHNATLREQGLELMNALEVAVIPVDHDMAVKKGWGNMPLDELERRLNEITNDGVLRIDKGVPPALAGRVEQDPSKTLYYEVAI